MRVDEPGHQPLPAPVDPLAALVGPDAGDPAVGERDVPVQPLAGEGGEDARALDDGVGFGVAAGDRDEALHKPDHVIGPERDARQRPAGRRADRGHDRGRRGDRRRLADPAQPVRRVRVAELEDVELDRRHVEHRRDQVVGEGRVAHEAVDDLDLLHQREAEPLRDAALDLPLDRERVHRLADVLSGRDLDHPHQSQLGVDVDDRAMGGERERHVRVALAELVERDGRPVVVLAGHLDPVADLAQALPLLADRAARGLDGAAGHVGLARGRRGPGGADLRVRRQHEHVLDAELGPGDLAEHRDEALTHLGSRSVNLN